MRRGVALVVGWGTRTRRDAFRGSGAAAPAPTCGCARATFLRAGSSKEEIGKSPFVEQLLKKGYEVIYFTDVLDEYVMQVSQAGRRADAVAW